MFAWAPIPPALASLGRRRVSKFLLQRANVALAAGPGLRVSTAKAMSSIGLVENRNGCVMRSATSAPS